jgi:GDP-L-fucose synthase
MNLIDKRILITGASGFLGEHLVARLWSIGCRRLCLPRRSEFDLTREDEVCRLLITARPQVVIHLAARVGGIGANRRQPGTFAYENLVMGARLIEQCRQAEVEKFVLAGTICSYPRHTPVPFREATLWDGYPEETNAPYGLAKKMLLVQLQAYRQQFGFRSACLLLANLFGPGDHFELETSHVIPALIHKCAEAKRRRESAVTVWGTGIPTREFLYVEDAARALQLAAEKLDDPDPVNVGTGQETSIADLAQRVCRLVGYQGMLCFDPSRPDGQPRRCLDVTRARQQLGFDAQVPLEEGLRRTVAWYYGQKNFIAMNSKNPRILQASHAAG